MVDMQKLVATLRDEHGMCKHCGRGLEYRITGLADIAAWLVRFGFDKKPMGGATIRYRHNVFGLPICKSARRGGDLKHTQPWTTNLLLHAWMAGQGRILSFPRWHPLRAGEKASVPRCGRRRLVRTPSGATGPSGPILGSS